jgi:hypothetical protein
VGVSVLLTRGPGPGLGFVFDREDGVGHRDLVVEGHARDAGTALVAHQLEVVGFAADHATQSNQRVEIAAVGHGLEHDRDLQRAGHADVADVGLVDLEPLELGQAGLGELERERVIEAGPHDADAQALAGQLGGLALVSALHGDGVREDRWGGRGCSSGVQVPAATKPVISKP